MQQREQQLPECEEDAPPQRPQGVKGWRGCSSIEKATPSELVYPHSTERGSAHSQVHAGLGDRFVAKAAFFLPTIFHPSPWPLS